MVGAQVMGDSAGAGGFGYGRPGDSQQDRPDLSNTGWALMAMRVTQGAEDLRPKGEKRADVQWETALKYVEALQIKGDDAKAEDRGGFAYETAGERGGTTTSEGGKVTLQGYGSMTYAGMEALIYAQVGRDDPRVRSAIEWAGRHWNVDENPGMGNRGLFYYYTILAKSLSLLANDEALRNPEGKVVPWKADITAKLVSTQKEDGTWLNENNMFWEGDPALVTSYALLVLQYAAGK
jgi:squalene-hopene/tetraprenyl-beta-curcumene cyclase